MQKTSAVKSETQFIIEAIQNQCGTVLKENFTIGKGLSSAKLFIM